MPDLSALPPLTLPVLAELLRSSEPVRLDPATAERLEASRASQPQQPGAGATSPTAAQPEPASLLLAYAAGTGPEVPASLVRRLLLLKALRLSQLGAAAGTVRRLLDFYNREVWPVVVEQGSLGEAGDEIPLAQLCLPLLGLGEVNYQGYRLAAADVLELFGWAPLALSVSECQQLLSGSEFTLAYATEALERAERLLQAAATIGALSSDVYGAAPAAEASGQDPAGTQLAATQLRALLANSELPTQPWAAPKAQPDPTAFRSLASLHTASAYALTQARQVVETQLSAISTASKPAQHSPAGGTQLPSQPLALALDQLALAVAGLGSLAAQRTAHLVSGARGLPPHLSADPTRSWGLLALPRTAAALVGANKQLTAPAATSEASDDSILGLLSAGATAPTTRQVVAHSEQLLGLELLTAAQALDLRRPARSSPALEAVVATFREHVTFMAHDRALAADLQAAARFVREYAWAGAAR